MGKGNDKTQLVFTAIQWLVIFRYRTFTPLTWALIFLEELLALYPHLFKPIPVTPPGQIGSYLMLPVSAVMLLLSLSTPTGRGQTREAPESPGAHQAGGRVSPLHL